MRKVIPLAAILIAGSFSVNAAGIAMPAPLPGPYFAAPYAQNMAPLQTMQQPSLQAQKPYWMQAPRQQLPYWMSGPFGENDTASQGSANAQTNTQIQGGAGFSAQNQVYGSSTAPGSFPSYGATPQAAPATPATPEQSQYAPQSAPFSGTPPNAYPPQQFWNAPWNWGPQNFGQWGPFQNNGQPYGAPVRR